MKKSVLFVRKNLGEAVKENLLQSFVQLNVREHIKKVKILLAVDPKQEKIKFVLYAIKYFMLHFVIKIASIVQENAITPLMGIGLEGKITGIGKVEYPQKIRNFVNQKDIEIGVEKFLFGMILLVRYVIKRVENLKRIILTLGRGIQRKDLLLVMEEHYA